MMSDIYERFSGSIAERYMQRHTAYALLDGDELLKMT